MENEIKRIACMDIIEQLRLLGIAPGDTLFVHSAMRPMGYVEGGAQSVVRALLDAVGSEGTLIMPSFCFRHEREDPPVIDLKTDVSEMGRISERLRTWEGARQSVAYRHSVCAVGRYADEITRVDPALSVFDMRSSFGKMLGYDAKVLLLGVTYVNSTAHHFAEYILKVPDREAVYIPALLRDADGELKRITVCDYRPKSNPNNEYYAYPHDFNRIGLELEKRGLVKIGRVGNAIARLYSMRELIHYCLDHYAVEYNLFAEGPGGMTRLPVGIEVTMPYLDGAGRRDIAVWSCVRTEDIYRVNGELTPVRVP